jgi:hypothetical protein
LVVDTISLPDMFEREQLFAARLKQFKHREIPLADLPPEAGKLFPDSLSVVPAIGQPLVTQPFRIKYSVAKFFPRDAPTAAVAVLNHIN